MSISEKTIDMLFIRSGLAKSSFRETIYEQLPWQFYMPFITETQRLTRSLARISPKIYQSHDAFMMFYKPYSLVHTSLKKTNRVAPIWHALIKESIMSSKFYDANKFTAGSTELAIVASYQFLKTLYDKLFKELPLNEKLLESMQQDLRTELKNITDPQKIEQIVQQELSARALYWDKMSHVVNGAVASVLQTVQEYREAKEEADTDLMFFQSFGIGGLSFAKDVLSVLRFLKNRDEYRKRVRLIKYARVFTSRFASILPTSFMHEQAVSTAGGIYGVGRMNNHSSLNDILPSELAMLDNTVMRALFAIKFASRQLMAYQHATAVKPVLFVDKSGSMAGALGDSDIPKISVASGLAFAIYRKFNADIYLFDTEVTAVTPKDVVETLLTIDADGGTDIDPVLEEITRIGKKEYIYIIISDGITSANDYTLEDFRKTGLASNTKLILIPPAYEGYNWVYLLKQYNNVQYANDIASFEKAVKNALR